MTKIERTMRTTTAVAVLTSLAGLSVGAGEPGRPAATPPAFFDVKAGKIVGDRVNHADLIFEASNMIKVSQFLDIFYIGLGYTYSDFSTFSYHSIGT